MKGKSTTTIARRLGTTAQKLHKLLEENGVIKRMQNGWFLRERYRGKSYAVEMTLDHGARHMRWTDRGVQLINEVFNQNKEVTYDKV